MGHAARGASAALLLHCKDSLLHRTSSILIS